MSVRTLSRFRIEGAYASLVILFLQHREQVVDRLLPWMNNGLVDMNLADVRNHSRVGQQHLRTLWIRDLWGHEIIHFRRIRSAPATPSSFMVYQRNLAYQERIQKLISFILIELITSPLTDVNQALYVQLCPLYTRIGFSAIAEIASSGSGWRHRFQPSGTFCRARPTPPPLSSVVCFLIIL